MTNHIDLTGNVYGFLTAIRRMPSVNGATFWLFKCQCGIEKSIASGNVKSGSIRSCGCHRQRLGVALAERYAGSRFVSIAGQKFSRLTAVSYQGGSKWYCTCDCGGNTTTKAGKLKSGHSKSCGCLGGEATTKRNTTHGLSGTLTYNSWRAMKERCDKPSHQNYKLYGGRGINYDLAWKSFDAFYADMGDCPEGHSIDRIDNDAGYCKSNCRWATDEIQQSNTRQNVRLTLSGETLIVAQWARKLGIPAHRIYNRLRHGWSHERALSTVHAIR